MVSFKSRCIALRKRGLSINQIVVKTGRPKTSVYFHIKQFPLNELRKKEIRLAAIKRFNDYSRSIKGKSRLNRHPIPFAIWNTQLVSLIGHLTFDGEIKRSGCVYTNRNFSLHRNVELCMKEVYPFLPKKYESLPGVHKTAYHNVELATYLKKKKGGLIGKISVMNIGLQRAFLRAFFDDEGSVYFIGKRRAVRGYQHSVQILKLIHVLLKKFGIESKVDEKYNEITITRRENIAQFSKEINFSKGVTVNGKRSNSVWKQSLEKRHILRQALASYA